MASVSLQPVSTDADLDALAAIVGEAFSFDVEGARKWIDERVQRANARVLHSEGKIVGGLGVVPMGQFFGGRRIGAGGVLGVAMLPADRGKGLAREMMRLSLREQYAAGLPLSTLYPATISLYRRADYEIAGTRSRLSAAARDLPAQSAADVQIREIAPEDYAGLARAHVQSAAISPGFLDRSEYFWERVRSPQGKSTRGFVALRDGRITGGVHYLQRRLDSAGCQTMELTDLTAVDGDSARALWALVASHRSVVGEVVWHGSERDPLLLSFEERRFKVELGDYWMVRIVNVEAALAARGYPVGITGELHLEIQDDLIGENAGRRVLSVTRGSPHVARGGRGDVKLHVRSLAPLFTGYFSASELARVGRVSGDAAALAAADALFASVSPWMRDSF